MPKTLSEFSRRHHYGTTQLIPKQALLFPRIIFIAPFCPVVFFSLPLTQECVPDSPHLAVLREIDDKTEKSWVYQKIPSYIPMKISQL